MKKIVAVLFVLLLALAACKGKGSDGKKQQDDKSGIVIKTLPEQQVAYVKAKGKFDKISGAFKKIFAYLGKNKLMPSAAPLGFFYTDPKKVKPEDNRWEVAVPFKGKLKDGDGVNVRVIAATKVVSISYEGEFGSKKYSECYVKLGKYMKDKALKAAGVPREIYHATKGIMGAKTNKVEIVIPIAK